MLTAASSATSLLLKRFCNIQDVDEWISDIFSPSIATRRSAEKLLRIYDSTSAKKPDIVYLRGLISHLTFDGSTENGTYQTIKSAYSSACNLRADGHMNAWNSLRSLSLFLERHADHQRRRGEAEVRNSDEMPFIVVPELSERTVEPWALAQRTLFTVHDPASRSRVKETFMRWYTAESGEYTINDQRQPDRHELIDPRDAMERFGGNYFAHGDARNDSPALWGRTARFHEESPEEAEVRRRRREAVVFHEGSGSIEQEDIFQRQLPTWQEPLDHQEQTRWEQVVERMA